VFRKESVNVLSSSRLEGIARVVERRRERETHIRLQRGSNDEVER